MAVPEPKARTIPDLIDEMARRHPDREALVGGDARYTYATLRAAIRAMARGLHALGVRRGDRVAILMGNRPDWLVVDLAVMLLGGVVVGVNTWATPRELRYVLEHAECPVLVTVPRYLKADYPAMLAEIRAEPGALPALRTVVLAGEARGHDGPTLDAVLRMGEGLGEAVIDAAQAGIAPGDLCHLLYTSGSTSRPKGVQLQHHAVIENMWRIGERQRQTEADRLWLAVSLFWALGCVNAVFAVLTHGGCIVLQEHFDAGEALRLIEAERCTLFYGTPNMGQALWEHPDRPGRDLSSLRSGATIGTPEQIQRVIDLGARDVCNIYGLTETYGNCCVTDAHDPPALRRTTVGPPLPGVELRIVDPETRQTLPRGRIGEILVRGYVTIGYYNEPEINAASFDDGWFLTGDLGLVDETGRLQFRGRLKEMVKTGGINVAPIEVEEWLMTHPAVDLACVVGVPDAVRDEVLGAVIVARDPDAPGVDAEALQAHCRAGLAAYKVPRLFRFVRQRDLPLTTTGKLRKLDLARLFEAGA